MVNTGEILLARQFCMHVKGIHFCIFFACMSREFIFVSFLPACQGNLFLYNFVCMSRELILQLVFVLKLPTHYLTKINLSNN